jgi:hypothetical protein
MSALAEAETVSIKIRSAGSGSESRHLACEHHQTAVGTQEPPDQLKAERQKTELTGR